MTVSYEIDGETYNFADGTTREEAVKKLEQFKKEKEQQTTSTKDPEYEGVGVELAEGIVSGGSKIVQGLAELGVGAVDLIADTDYSKKVKDKVVVIKINETEWDGTSRGVDSSSPPYILAAYAFNAKYGANEYDVNSNNHNFYNCLFANNA